MVREFKERILTRLPLFMVAWLVLCLGVSFTPPSLPSVQMELHPQPLSPLEWQLFWGAIALTLLLVALPLAEEKKLAKEEQYEDR